MILLMRRKEISEIVVVLVLTGFLTTALNIQLAWAQPRTWIVDDDGPADFHTIQEAVNAASPGDVIFVRNGSYCEHVVVNKALSLLGEDRSATVIDGNGTTVLRITANQVVVNGFTIKGSGGFGESGIYLNDACCCNVTNNYVADNNWGICLWGSSDNGISRNIVTNNGQGILLDSASSNSIFGNNITGNPGRGISLLGGDSNRIFGNNIANNVFGIELDHSWHNGIFGNNIVTSAIGIKASFSDYNHVYGNNIAANSDVGISLWHADKNMICHNNFVNNREQIFVYVEALNNTWDDGYPSGGNYWSDYVGLDLYSGPYQNETGSDGIGDTPYLIADNTDRYPLMNPWTPPDIAVMNITPSKTIIGQGFALSINVTVTNQGNKIEGFNIIAYANTTSIKSQNVTLTSGNSTTITFTWNTTGFAKGNYTIKAYAWPVPGETDTTDNTFNDVTVFVTVAGDVTGEGLCDIQDISILVDKFLAEPSDPRWDVNCDVQDDLIIDMADISIAIDHFLQEFTP